ncbi:MAG: rhomboid family intramembrane serine protease [bacterium]
MYFFYFYPLGVDLQQKCRPLLTAALVAVMTVLFIWTYYFPRAIGIDPVSLIFTPGNGRPWTVLTAILLHGSWFHFLGNMIYLIVFAPLLEDRLGRWRLLHYFFLLGAAGNVAHGLITVLGGPAAGAAGVLGASGSISGLLAFALVRFYFARLALAYWVFTPLQGICKAGKAYLPLPVAVGLWLMLQIAHSLVATQSGSLVAYGAHFGGFGLGLLLALLLGYRVQARAESCLVKGQRFMEKGEAYAAEGEFMEFLEQLPDSRQGRLLLARSRRMLGQNGVAQIDYRLVFRQFVAQGEINEALEVFREARSGGSYTALEPGDLAKAAFFLEKQLDFAGAVDAYLDLYRQFPASEHAELALVRAIVLFKTQLQDLDTARRWFEVARQEMPRSVWRDFLAEEFKLARKPRATDPEGGTSFLPESAI